LKIASVIDDVVVFTALVDDAVDHTENANMNSAGSPAVTD
jgi:hypothetical protein